MIKKCRQCGCVLKSEENNKLCEKCRVKKRNQLVEMRNAVVEKKRKKIW